MFKVGDIIQAIDTDSLGYTQWKLTSYEEDEEYCFNSKTVGLSYEWQFYWSMAYLVENMRIVNTDELPYSHRS